MEKNINEQKLSELRKEITVSMSEKRATHTLAVESMAIRLGRLYAPDKLEILRAAALLHDITKEKKKDEQIFLCKKYGVELDENALFSPKTLHARTAAAMIPDKYGDFADDAVVSAVRWHTTGHKGMTILEKIIYLADYIDESRTFDDCVTLRNKFWIPGIENMSDEERRAHLIDVLILSYDMTIKNLIEENSPVASDTIDARNELICEKLKANTQKG